MPGWVVKRGASLVFPGCKVFFWYFAGSLPHDCFVGWYSKYHVFFIETTGRSPAGVYHCSLTFSSASALCRYALKRLRSGNGTGGLSVGRATIWLCVVSRNFNLDSFTMAAAPTSPPSPSPEVDTSAAFGGIPASIPGTIHAENFDVGGEGVAYSDTDPGNNGGVSGRGLL